MKFPTYHLSHWQQLGGIFLAWAMVAFGQPAWLGGLGIVAAILGFALFWRVMWSFHSRSQQFWIASGWFCAVQFVQLSWFISHPYAYIYAVYVFFAAALGLQFGLLSLLVTPSRLLQWTSTVAIAAIWTLMEWARLFFLSGFTFSPVGLALTASLYPLQLASLFGVYGLSFVVVWTNLWMLRVWLTRSKMALTCGIALALLPYALGWAHVAWHKNKLEGANTFGVLLVQTGFPAEETLKFEDGASTIRYVLGEWHQIAQLVQPHAGKKIDLIVFPEGLVPYGTYYTVYPYQHVKKIFSNTFGESSVNKLPVPQAPLAMEVPLPHGPTMMVNNAFWLQGLANILNAPIVAGLDDSDDEGSQRHTYNAALFFLPNQQEPLQRYEKRVLLPFGEYIPFEFCRKMASYYGIGGSFTPGVEAKNIPCNVPVGLSICYEETFGDLMRESRQQGAEILVNLTSDVWYPESTLTLQHRDLARLRTVENGIPLARACNTGITAGFDSLGRVVGAVGEGVRYPDWISEALFLNIPTYTYHTVYTLLGDRLIVAFSFLASLLIFRKRQRN